MTVLFLDDDRALLAMIVRALPAAWTIWTAATVDEALRLSHSKYPSVVVVDPGLAGADGIDAIPELRAANERAKIIVWTCGYNADDGERALDSGAITYLEKGDSVALREAIRVARVMIPVAYHPGPAEHQ